jgi:hypothetical protein
MVRGRRKAARQLPLFVTADALPKSPGHPFYRALNRLLAEANFDRWAEERCRLYSVDSPRGQPSLPPGGMRRTWLKGLGDVMKRYLIATAAHNLGRMLRPLFGVGKPRASGACQRTISRPNWRSHGCGSWWPSP